MVNKNIEEDGEKLDKKRSILLKTMNEIEKTKGKGSVMFMDSKAIDMERMPTGFYSLDYILGGGIPRGRIIEIYGPESHGKTTLALQLAAEFQRHNEIVGYIDVEHALDPAYAMKLGVDINNMVISQPDCGEDALDIVQSLISSGVVGLVVIDSVAALSPKAEIEGSMGDNQVGLVARLMSKAMRKIVSIADSTKCDVIFINQIREKVGVVYGNPEVSTGGRALKFFSSIRMEVRRKESIKKGTEEIGFTAQIKTKKNKTFAPFKTALIDSIFGYGFDKMSDMINFAINNTIIDKSGSWFSYKQKQIGQGKNKVSEFLTDPNNKDIFEEIQDLCNKKLYELTHDNISQNKEKDD